MFHHKFTLFILFISLCLIVIGCSQKDNNKLRVGYGLTSAPYSFYNDNNELEGFDIDIVKELTKKMNIDYEMIEMPFKELIIKLNLNHIDMAISSQYITPTRQEVVDFSIPYGSSCTAMAVNANSNIKSLKDVKKHNITIGTKQGTTHARYLLNSEYKDIIQLYPTQNDLMIAFMTHRIEGIITDKRILDSLENDKKFKMKLFKDCISEFQVFGITIKKDNKELQTKINTALEEMKKDGSYNRIALKWFKKNPLDEYDDYMNKKNHTTE